MTKKLSSTAVTFILLGIAAALLLFSTIGGAKATLDEAAMLELQMGTKTMVNSVSCQEMMTSVVK